MPIDTTPLRQYAIDLAASSGDPMAVADALKSVYNQILAGHARAVLREAFPGYQAAILFRGWDEDFAQVVKLVPAPGSDLPELKANASFDSLAGLTREQKAAVGTVDTIVRYIGSDEELAEHASYGATHTDWTEFVLDLSPTGQESVASRMGGVTRIVLTEDAVVLVRSDAGYDPVAGALRQHHVGDHGLDTAGTLALVESWRGTDRAVELATAQGRERLLEPGAGWS